MNTPLDISLAEWAELMKVPDVIDGWGLEDETPSEFASTVYGVKFDFVCEQPGYVGPLYILQGGALSAAPLVLGVIDGELSVFEF
ncbi:MAG TPA: hypothetical protein VI306_09865 [Pyrinomonadaceae bacterium]